MSENESRTRTSIAGVGVHACRLAGLVEVAEKAGSLGVWGLGFKRALIIMRTTSAKGTGMDQGLKERDCSSKNSVSCAWVSLPMREEDGGRDSIDKYTMYGSIDHMARSSAKRH